MLSRYSRFLRWMLLIGTGSFLFQAASCDLVLQSIQTGLLGGIAGLLFFLSRNV